MNQPSSLTHLRFAAPLVLCTLAACGGSSGSPPTISDLMISTDAIEVGEENTLTGTLVLSDPAGEESEIDATITLPGGQSETLPPTSLQDADGQMNATVDFAIIVAPPAAGSYGLSVFVKDSDGKSSNALMTTLTAQ